MSNGKSVRVQTDDLSVGCVIKHPINDPTGMLLLAGGSRITDQIKEGLKRRNINAVFLHPDDVAAASGSGLSSPGTTAPKKRATRTTPRRTDIQAKIDNLAHTVSFVVENTGEAIRERALSPGTAPYNSEKQKQLTEEFSAATTLLTNMVDSVLKGSKQDAKELASVATNYVTELTEDSGQVISSSAEMAKNPDVTQRSVRMSILAMSIAIEMKYDEENVRTVGVAALVHDWGLFSLDERFRDPNAPWTQSDWLQFMKHPIKSVDLLERVSGVSDLIRVVCYQVHERIDGGGYPKGRQGEVIHIFARIIAVADAYISMVSQVRGRPAVIPYDAVIYLMHQVKLGKLDGKVVRALMHTMSAFPVGSHIRLSDGSEGKVIRSNGEEYMKPIVQKVADENGIRIDSPHKMQIIDLADSQLTLSMPLPTPGRGEMRLDIELMNDVEWDGPDS